MRPIYGQTDLDRRCGNRDAILPFSYGGFQSHPVTEPQAINTLRKLSQENWDYLPDRGYYSSHSRYSSTRPAADTGSDPYPDS